MVKVTPPGNLCPSPALLQQPAVHRAPSPPPPYQSGSGGFDFDPDESDEGSDEDGATVPKDDRSLEDLGTVPQFWGVVQVSNVGNAPGRQGLERDNAMCYMLSRNAYLSQASNTVFVGDSAREALEFERDGRVYSPFGPKNDQNNQVYIRSYRGLPLNPHQVKKLRTLSRSSRKTPIRQRIEAYLLLRELYVIANWVIPQHRDRAMSFLLEPNGFDLTPPMSIPHRVLGEIRPLPRDVPPRQEQPRPPRLPLASFGAHHECSLPARTRPGDTWSFRSTPIRIPVAGSIACYIVSFVW